MTQDAAGNAGPRVARFFAASFVALIAIAAVTSAFLHHWFRSEQASYRCPPDIEGEVVSISFGGTWCRPPVGQEVLAVRGGHSWFTPTWSLLVLVVVTMVATLAVVATTRLTRPRHTPIRQSGGEPAGAH